MVLLELSLCAAPFVTEGEKNCTAFFCLFGSGEKLVGVFSAQICVLDALLHVYWSSFGATFLANCVTF